MSDSGAGKGPRPPVPGRVSVCVPAHREGQWFRDALASVNSQTYEDVELIVTDDSGGSLREIAESAGAKYFANETRLGFAGNHCRALNIASGEFIAFLHDDDRWDDDFLEQATRPMKEDGRIGLVFAGVEEIDSRDRPLGRRPARMARGLQEAAFELLAARDFMLMLPSAVVTRRSALPPVSSWPDVITADMVMYLDVVVSGWKLWHEPNAILRYRTHEGQVGNNDVAFRTGLIAVWSLYKFEANSQWESVRVARLAETYAARGGALARMGRGHEARADFREAVRLSSRTLRPKLILAWCLSYSSGAARLSAIVWDRIRDPVAKRHRG